MCYNKTQPERERLMNDFFAYVNRLKYIERWGLMRRTESENLWEHSFQTAVLAHCLALIAKNELGKKADENRVAARALFHDVTEALTGDLPTPVKYYDEDILQAYKRIEEGARQKLLNSLPDAYARCYAPLLDERCREEDEICRYEKKLVKYADKLSAYLKCKTELNLGNGEFKKALSAIENELDAFDSDEIRFFLENFAPSFELTLDELE